MTDVSANWKDSLNTGLVNRLNRPLNQPGMIKMAMSSRIINRCDRLLNRLPLLSQQMQRWGNVNTAVSKDVPIVYAQPISASNQSSLESTEQNVQRTVPVIQRKEKPSDNVTPSLSLENQINQNNQTYISSSQIPAVSSQAISQQITESEEMPLQSNIKNENNSVPLIQRKLDNSQSSTIQSVDNIKNSENITPVLDLENQINQINQTSISSSQSSSQIPVVSSQAISEQITESEEMPFQSNIKNENNSVPLIQRKLDNSQSSTIQSVDNIKNSENITPALGLESQNNQNNQNNQTSISSSQIPVVSSQVISQQITETGEMPLLQDFISSSQQLTIVQVKQQSSNLSSSHPPVTSHLPVTNPLNTFTASKQTQVENNSENINPSKTENLVTDISLTNLPIVTTQAADEQKKSNTQNTQNNHNLPLISIATSIKTPEKNKPLPLTKNYSSSPIINNSQTNLSNNNSSSPPKVLSLPSQPTEKIVSPLSNQSNSTNLKKIDIDTIVNQVERKLMRRLVIESERRGKIR